MPANSATPHCSTVHRQSLKTAPNAPIPRPTPLPTVPRLVSLEPKELQHKHQRLTMGHQLVEPKEQQRKQLVRQQLVGKQQKQQLLTMGQQLVEQLVGQQQKQWRLTMGQQLVEQLVGQQFLGQQQKQRRLTIGQQLVEKLVGQQQWQQQLTNSPTRPTPLRSNLELVLQQKQQRPTLGQLTKCQQQVLRGQQLLCAAQSRAPDEWHLPLQCALLSPLLFRASGDQDSAGDPRNWLLRQLQPPPGPRDPS